jgi:2-polyprenyl-3-methyl-5-hydroxy-6-metoxy-1,4-benzoquinol methylase
MRNFLNHNHINLNCSICNKKKFRKITSSVRDSNSHRTICCTNCGHFQLFPIPTSNDEKIFYDQNKQAKNINVIFNIPVLRERSKFDTQRRINIVSKLVSKQKRILDIGSGYGFFLEGLKNKKYNVSGIEVSKDRRKISKKNSNAELFNVNLINETPEIGKFDLVVMFHVLEHIADPINFLKKIRQLMNPKAQILIEVPNLDDFQINLNEAYRKWYWQRAHLQYFSPKTLKKVLKESGFKKISVFGNQRYSLENMMSWKINNEPQIKIPTFLMTKDYEWIDEHYKKNLEKNLKCDTVLAKAYL